MYNVPVNESLAGNGWFKDQQSATGAVCNIPATVNNLKSTATVTIRKYLNEESPATGSILDWNKTLALFLLGYGTCVANPDIKHLQDFFRTDSFPNVAAQNHREGNKITPSKLIVSPKHKIKNILNVFSPAVSDLAIAFGVSRQTIYNWLNDKPIDADHLDKLDDLNLAADIFAESDMPMSGWLLKRKIIDGKGLLEFVRDGCSAQQAVRQLLQILRSESEQRNRIDARLAGRKRTFLSPESEFPAENDIGE